MMQQQVHCDQRKDDLLIAVSYHPTPRRQCT
jgi:hypothetical protein